MKPATRIRDLFVADVTRDIPPVVYFHEQSPQKLAVEVSEYIITGGYPDGHPGKKRIPEGIHEHYVRLLRAIADELDRPGGPEPADLLDLRLLRLGQVELRQAPRLALDGAELPDGRSLAEALLARDTSPASQELRDAWAASRPRSIRWPSSSTSAAPPATASTSTRSPCAWSRSASATARPTLVADFELKLERDKEWKRFEKVAKDTLGRPWSEVKDRRWPRRSSRWSCTPCTPSATPTR
jgi:hypothetical protein